MIPSLKAHNDRLKGRVAGLERELATARKQERFLMDTLRLATNKLECLLTGNDFRFAAENTLAYLNTVVRREVK